ncbi:hypothetical protein T265_05339 [Opisthorchis viverrini]|uniref:Uncharacterized protein n=1 Tax=Opisthorchis viverrini TaxID=6198 RepID=A0A074ZW73_OPIVI|nr:hypothetical protein T265_05339 [Opisthorchis viverrini]KER27615.1 hypothetical protein T265_05339 [Opisthorchis viverrini]
MPSFGPCPARDTSVQMMWCSFNRYDQIFSQLKDGTSGFRLVIDVVQNHKVSRRMSDRLLCTLRLVEYEADLKKTKQGGIQGWPPFCLRHSELGMENSTLFGKRWFGIRNTCSQPTQLLVLDIFFNGSTRCTTKNTLSNCLVMDSRTPTHTSYGSETTIVDHVKTSQFRCSNRSSLTTTQQNSPYCSLIHTLANAARALQIRAFTSSVTLQSELIQLPRHVKCSTTFSTSPWIVSGVFSDRMSTSMTLHCMGAKFIPKDGMTLVSSSKNTCAFPSSLKMRTILSAYSRSTKFSSRELFEHQGFGDRPAALHYVRRLLETWPYNFICTKV